LLRIESQLEELRSEFAITANLQAELESSHNAKQELEHRINTANIHLEAKMRELDRLNDEKQQNLEDAKKLQEIVASLKADLESEQQGKKLLETIQIEQLQEANASASAAQAAEQDSKQRLQEAEEHIKVLQQEKQSFAKKVSLATSHPATDEDRPRVTYRKLKLNCTVT
jgi:chromosome segregation ATPase